MSYNRLNWTANKPINTANLNAMDKGISDAHEALEGIEKPIDYLSSSSTAPVQSKVMYTVVKNIERGNVTDEQLANAVENYFEENPLTLLTETDKSDIARMVIESLGGNPVFGYVDENNNIIVSGKLASGTYSVKYEMEDGTTIDIGNLEFDSNVYYSVTNNLTNCTNSNSTTQAIAGNSYTATISAKSGYELSSVTVTMGGSPVSVSGGNINISNVTGDIVITAVAEESAVIPTYTNLAEPDAESTGEEAWNNGGWCNDSYMAGTTYAYRYGTGRITTNKFAVEYGDTIYVKGINYTEDSTLQIAIFDVNGEYIKHNSAYNMHINQGVLKSLTGTVGEDYWHFKNEAKTDSADCGTRFIRIAGAPSGSVSDIIITRNQEIV